MKRCRRALTLSVIISALIFSVASAQTPSASSRVLKAPATNLLTFAAPDALALTRASAIPVIDGAPDALWNSAPEQIMAVFASDGSTTPADNNRDLSARFRILWDDDNLYVFAAITDEDVATPQNLNPWERDGFRALF